MIECPFNFKKHQKFISNGHIIVERLQDKP